MDLRRKRRDKSRLAIEQAIDRLRSGNGTHPRHAGIHVRITKAAIAREAKIGQATLYRFPDICAQIDELLGNKLEQKLRPAEQRRTKFISQIQELERRVKDVLSENARLQRELAKYDPLLGLRSPTHLEEYRKKRSRTSRGK